MSSPLDLAALFGQLIQLLPWIMVIALLPVLIKSIVEAIKEFRT